MNVKWEDVKQDYARKDAEIAELREALEKVLEAHTGRTGKLTEETIKICSKALGK